MDTITRTTLRASLAYQLGFIGRKDSALSAAIQAILNVTSGKGDIAIPYLQEALVLVLKSSHASAKPLGRRGV